MLKKIIYSFRIWIVSLFNRFQIKPKPIDNPVSTNKDQIRLGDGVEKDIPYFSRANNLRDEFTGKEVLVEYKGILYRESELKQFKELEDKFDKEGVPNDYSPWEDCKKYPKKTFVIAEQDFEKEKAIADTMTIIRGDKMSTQVSNNVDYDDLIEPEEDEE